MTTYAAYYLLSPASQTYHRNPSTSSSTPSSASISSTTAPQPSRTSSISSITPLVQSIPTEKHQHHSSDASTSRSGKWYDFLKPLD
ncbi:hypothetical protein GJ744_008147 [Endocarpon pusillum]|uniref:Uncharacterized protein n=1 Tax=Endocarpon pusillum TaxID=364733 RepID=A0A8H7AHK1_9EURO|nr:hypothetical protein GJ744_008147 [Endocarpon pusillum]